MTPTSHVAPAADGSRGPRGGLGLATLWLLVLAIFGLLAKLTVPSLPGEREVYLVVAFVVVGIQVVSLIWIDRGPIRLMRGGLLTTLTLLTTYLD